MREYIATVMSVDVSNHVRNGNRTIIYLSTGSDKYWTKLSAGTNRNEVKKVYFRFFYNLLYKGHVVCSRLHTYVYVWYVFLGAGRGSWAKTENELQVKKVKGPPYSNQECDVSGWMTDEEVGSSLGVVFRVYALITRIS
jgi:hypothetical protein